MGSIATGSGRKGSTGSKEEWLEEGRKAKEARASATPTPPPAPDPSTTSLDLSGGDASNFAADLRRRRKKTRTNFGGVTGGYGGSTKLG